MTSQLATGGNGKIEVSAPADTRHVHPRRLLRPLALYFLRLGTWGFGGPIALAGYMHKDLVEKRGWVSKDDYMEALAFAQLSPGPLAAQLAMYLGWVDGGIIGATLTGVSFILPSFLMVLVLAGLYVHFGQLAWIVGIFYGIGAAVIAIIARSAFKLVRTTVGKDPLLWVIFAVLAVTTAWTESEIIWLFVLCGLVALVAKAPPRFLKARSVTPAFLFPAWLLSGAGGTASIGVLSTLFLFFAKAGAFVFGSGLAIVPFLYGGVVHQFHWLDERQFLDAVAVAMITPGPVVITAGFIGYLVAGPLGATVAAVAVFAPPYFIVLAAAPYYRRFAQNRRVKAFVQGVTAAAVGAITGAAFVLGRRAITDLPTFLIASLSLALLLRTKRVPEPMLILIAGAVGLAIQHSR